MLATRVPSCGANRNLCGMRDGYNDRLDKDV
jgi:hypothetical protein